MIFFVRISAPQLIIVLFVARDETETLRYRKFNKNLNGLFWRICCCWSRGGRYCCCCWCQFSNCLRTSSSKWNIVASACFFRSSKEEHWSSMSISSKLQMYCCFDCIQNSLTVNLIVWCSYPNNTHKQGLRTTKSSWLISKHKTRSQPSWLQHSFLGFISDGYHKTVLK